MINNNLNKMFDTSYRFIVLAEKMLRSCQAKKEKVCSNCRFVISFFFRRTWEMFESLIILVKENRVIDSAVLLRSFCDLGFSFGYIMSDKERKEINSLKYRLEGNEAQLKLINSNLEGFKEFDSNIGQKRDKLREVKERIIEDLKNEYNEEKMDLPPIEQRAILSESEVIKGIYNQCYRFYSTIEHHSMLFGKNYVVEDKCEPRNQLDDIINHPLLKSEFMIYTFRLIFIAILNAFNEEFSLKWADELTNLMKTHEEESKYYLNN